MDMVREEHVRERAYHLWLADGCVDGKADQHWMKALGEIGSAVAAPAVRGKRAPGATGARKPRARKA